MVSSTPSVEIERGMALHDRLQNAEQGHNEGGIADYEHEGDATEHWARP